VQVLTEPAAEPDLDRASYLAAEDPVQGDTAISAAFAAATPEELEQANAVLTGGNGAVGGATNRMADDGETQLPIVKSDREKIGRNEPCWCGSGKKFKFCHGAN
jgi:preprotein translocase subunit SecA